MTTEIPIDRAGRPPGPQTDVAFDLLSRCHRRFALYCLDSHDGAIDLPQLVECVLRLFEDSPTATQPAYDILQTRLVHTTLPRLDDAGVVVYDREAGVIWPTESVDALEPLLAISAELDFADSTALECLANK